MTLEFNRKINGVEYSFKFDDGHLVLTPVKDEEIRRLSVGANFKYDDSFLGWDEKTYTVKKLSINVPKDFKNVKFTDIQINNIGKVSLYNVDTTSVVTAWTKKYTQNIFDKAREFRKENAAAILLGHKKLPEDLNTDGFGRNKIFIYNSKIDHVISGDENIILGNEGKPQPLEINIFRCGYDQSVFDNDQHSRIGTINTKAEIQADGDVTFFSPIFDEKTLLNADINHPEFVNVTIDNREMRGSLSVSGRSNRGTGETILRSSIIHCDIEAVNLDSKYSKHNGNVITYGNAFVKRSDTEGDFRASNLVTSYTDEKFGGDVVVTNTTKLCDDVITGNLTSKNIKSSSSEIKGNVSASGNVDFQESKVFGSVDLAPKTREAAEFFANKSTFAKPVTVRRANVETTGSTFSSTVTFIDLEPGSRLFTSQFADTVLKSCERMVEIAGSEFSKLMLEFGSKAVIVRPGQDVEKKTSFADIVDLSAGSYLRDDKGLLKYTKTIVSGNSGIEGPNGAVDLFGTN